MDVIAPQIDLACFSDQLTVPVKVYALDAPRLLWINRRWMASVGWDAGDRHFLDELSAHFLSSFGVTSVREMSQGLRTHTLYADRYGGSGGSVHGGSGRSAALGPWLAKGIGPTSLVSANADWGHSHGFLLLSDAIREAVAADLIAQELTPGNEQPVAVLDAGVAVATDTSQPPERCAILIRSSFLRAAHLERSIFFGTAGFRGSDQFNDALRVQAMIETLGDWNAGAFFERVGRRMGESRAHRLWCGRHTSDNLTLSAGYLDYGNFRALPSWHQASDTHGQVFGDEHADLRRIAPSLAHYLNKYGSQASTPPLLPASLIETGQKGIDLGFEAACRTACALDASPEAGDIVNLLRNLFLMQQRVRCCVDEPSSAWKRSDWLHHALTNTGKHHRRFVSQAVADAAAHLTSLLANDEHRASWHRLLWWVRPRPTQYYHVAKYRARNMVTRALDSADAPKRVGAFVDREVALARRTWPGVPSSCCVTAYQQTAGYRATHCMAENGVPLVHVELVDCRQRDHWANALWHRTPSGAWCATLSLSAWQSHMGKLV